MSEELNISGDTEVIWGIYKRINEPRQKLRQNDDGQSLGTYYPDGTYESAYKIKSQAIFTMSELEKISNNKVLEKYSEVEKVVGGSVLDFLDAGSFVDNIKSIIEPFKKLDGVKKFVAKYHADENNIFKSFHGDTNLVTILETNKVVDDLKKYFEKEMIPFLEGVEKVKGPFYKK